MAVASRSGAGIPVAPMLATAGPAPATDGWLTEFKWDGVRCIVRIAGGVLRCWSRSGREVTGEYPELAGLAALAGGHELVLDAELVCLDPQGRPDFGLWQRRMHVRPGETPPAPTLYVFDFLRLDGTDLVDLPLRERRGLLESLDLDADGIRTPAAFDDLTPAEALAVAAEHGLEGVVAKRPDSRYLPGQRSTAWIKAKHARHAEVVIGGWTDVKGPGRSIGAVTTGAFDEHGDLVYLGRCGSGLDGRTDRALRGLFADLALGHCPFSDPERIDVPAAAVHWVRPVVVAEVRHAGLAGDGRLRHPVWRGLRPDRRADEIRYADVIAT